MPKFYPDNDRPIEPYSPKSIYLGSIRRQGKGALQLEMKSNYSSYVPHYPLPIVYGNMLLTIHDEINVAKAILQNQSKCTTCFVSHKRKEAIQGHIYWSWE